MTTVDATGARLQLAKLLSSFNENAEEAKITEAHELVETLPTELLSVVVNLVFQDIDEVGAFARRERLKLIGYMATVRYSEISQQIRLIVNLLVRQCDERDPRTRQELTQVVAQIAIAVVKEDTHRKGLKIFLDPMLKSFSVTRDHHQLLICRCLYHVLLQVQVDTYTEELLKFLDKLLRAIGQNGSVAEVFLVIQRCVEILRANMQSRDVKDILRFCVVGMRNQVDWNTRRLALETLFILAGTLKYDTVQDGTMSADTALLGPTRGAILKELDNIETDENEQVRQLAEDCIKIYNSIETPTAPISHQIPSIEQKPSQKESQARTRKSWGQPRSDSAKVRAKHYLAQPTPKNDRRLSRGKQHDVGVAIYVAGSPNPVDIQDGKESPQRLDSESPQPPALVRGIGVEADEPETVMDSPQARDDEDRHSDREIQTETNETVTNKSPQKPMEDNVQTSAAAAVSELAAEAVTGRPPQSPGACDSRGKPVVDSDKLTSPAGTDPAFGSDPAPAHEDAAQTHILEQTANNAPSHTPEPPESSSGVRPNSQQETDRLQEETNQCAKDPSPRGARVDIAAQQHATGNSGVHPQSDDMRKNFERHWGFADEVTARFRQEDVAPAHQTEEEKAEMLSSLVDMHLSEIERTYEQKKRQIIMNLQERYENDVVALQQKLLDDISEVEKETLRAVKLEMATFKQQKIPAIRELLTAQGYYRKSEQAASSSSHTHHGNSYSSLHNGSTHQQRTTIPLHPTSSTRSPFHISGLYPPPSNGHTMSQPSAQQPHHYQHQHVGPPTAYPPQSQKEQSPDPFDKWTPNPELINTANALADAALGTYSRDKQ